jgi:hypothetical protein
MLANDELRVAMAHLVGEFYPVIQRYYRDIAGIMGAVTAARQWLPMVAARQPGRCPTVRAAAAVAPAHLTGQ